MKENVILLSAPSIKERYYKPFFGDIVALFTRLIEASHPNDTPLVVVDKGTHPSLREHIDEDNLIIGSISDIWIRGFAPIHTPAGNFYFTYLPSYLSKKDAEYVQDSFAKWLFSMGTEEEKDISLVLEGDNFVYNGTDSAIVTDRILEDNPEFSKQQILALLKKQFNLEYLAIIPRESGNPLGDDSDGIVTWLTERCVGIAQLEETYRKTVLTCLEKELKEVELIELPNEVKNDTWRGKQDIVSHKNVKGMYVNALTTDNAIYVPIFDLDADNVAIETYRKHAQKEVIPIKMGSETELGGGIRSLTWSVGGDDAITLLDE